MEIGGFGGVHPINSQICPVDPSGKFLPVVTDFAGMYVKDADKEIIKKLKADGMHLLIIPTVLLITVQLL